MAFYWAGLAAGLLVNSLYTRNGQSLPGDERIHDSTVSGTCHVVPQGYVGRAFLRRAGIAVPAALSVGIEKSDSGTNTPGNTGIVRPPVRKIAR